MQVGATVWSGPWRLIGPDEYSQRVSILGYRDFGADDQDMILFSLHTEAGNDHIKFRCSLKLDK